jgi:Na+-transporting methylmalonyl-CoA/oxaloacetate decarboxylase gamma subunit
MNCSACARQLPAGVTYCPNCGTPTPAYYAPTGTTPDNPTVASSLSNEPPPPPYTNYGSQPYGMPSPYSTPPPAPYNTQPPASYISNGDVQLTPPPPPPSQRRGNRTGLIIGVVVLVLVVVVGGVLAVSHLASQASSSTATPTVAPAQAAATAQAHATATAITALTATAQVQATATASVIAANPNLYTPGSGKLALIDPLSDNSKGYAWNASTGTDGTCAFSGGAYHSSTPKTNFFYVCTADATDFSNFAFEVQLKILQGDCGGMIFRADSNSGKLYFFEACQDGTYLFSRYMDYTGNNVKDLAGGSSAAITTGLNQSNVIAVVAQGSTLSIYVNKQKIASASDSTFNHGQIGLFADSSSHPTEVAFNNAKVWTY